jgi:translation initiation factor 1
MPGLFDGTPLERPVTCPVCSRALAQCGCPRGASGQVVRPQDQPARVSREKRRGGKVVTVVSGLDAIATNLPALVARLRSACAAGGTVSQDRVEIQGDHRERVLAILRELGYPAKLSGG